MNGLSYSGGRGNFRVCFCSVWFWIGALLSVHAQLQSARDFGVLRLGEKKSHRLEYSSPSAGMLREIKTSCPCVRVLGYPVVVAANQSVGIELEIEGQTEGDFRYAVEVFLEGKSSPDTLYLDLSVRASAGKDAEGNSLYVSINEPTPANRVWVDVRSAEAYEKAHLPDALSIPLYAVKTKSFLRGQDVVLVDEGWGSPIVERACRDLRKAGFASAHILQGGVAAWHKAGRALSGLDISSADLISLRPTDFLSVRNRAKWNVIRVETNVTDTAQWLSFVQEIKTAASSNENANILILTENGKNDAGINRQLASLKAPIFYLEGGREALEEAMSLMDGKPHGGKQTITTRPSTQRGGKPQVLRKPCGSCPG